MSSLDRNITVRSRNDLVFQSQTTSIAVVCVVVVCFAFSIQTYVDTQILLVWTLLCLLSYALRLWLCLAYQYSSEDEKLERIWQIRFLAASVTSGSVWGAASFLIFPDSHTHQLVLVLLLIFLAAGVTMAYSAYKWASILFSVLALGPAAVQMLLQPGPGYDEVAGLIVGFLIVAIVASLYHEKVANRLLSLTATNASLVASLTKKNKAMEIHAARLEEAKLALGRANEELQMVVNSDSLTGLPNRSFFEERVKLKCLLNSKDRRPISLIILRVDYFKEFNDLYGQKRGDDCLLEITSFLNQVPQISRVGNCVSRYSKDEFRILVIDKGGDDSGVEKIAQELCRGVQLLRIPFAEMPAGHSPWISVSGGVAREQKMACDSYISLFERAEAALENAIKAGRNRVSTCDYSADSSGELVSAFIRL